MIRPALLCAIVLLGVSCGGAARPQTEPLATLGPLLPAPPPGPLGPGLVPVPDAPDLGPSGARAALRDGVGGIACQVNARVVFHHHAHLTLFVDGKQRRIPAGIGIWPPLEPQSTAPGQFSVTRGECFSWLVTRYADGLIHIEAPAARRFLLGEFFDIWGADTAPLPVQKRPPVMSAAQSGEGQSFAAQAADILFTGYHSHEQVADTIANMRRMSAAHGRTQDVFVETQFCIKPTRKEAEEYAQYYAGEMADPDALDYFRRQKSSTSSSSTS